MKDFNKPAIIRTAKRILKKVNICDNCLGRQFAQISTGMTNRDRGRILRRMIKLKEPEKCKICNNLFKNLDKLANRAVLETRGIEFQTFSVGSRPGHDLIAREESLWEDIGIKYCEPLKAELNRELGKLLEKKLKKKADEENPDLVILFDLEREKINLEIRPLFIHGKYKKLVRGIPQTKWDKYQETIEGIIAKPLIAVTKGSAHKMHGMGREDVDVLCLDWRPFVFEILAPKKRNINFKAVRLAVNRTKKIKIKNLRQTDKKEVIEIKKLRPDKTYRATVSFAKPLKNLDKLGELKLIKQRTPKRVLPRRADKLRERNVKDIKWKKIGKKLELKIRAEAGLYIKELITGDGGRTKPSVSSILKNPARVDKLDVIKIHLKRK